MPNAYWTAAEERQYQDIVQSYVAKGESKKRAQQIAAAVINTERRKRHELKGQINQKGRKHG
jgi:hypothetical protein